MKLPNKVIPYKESLIYKFPILLNILKFKPYTCIQLFTKTKHLFENVDDFIDVLDCLYALKKIKFDERSLKIKYAI